MTGKIWALALFMPLLSACAAQPHAAMARLPAARFQLARRLTTAPRQRALPPPPAPRVFGPVLKLPARKTLAPARGRVARANAKALLSPQAAFFRQAEAIYPYLPDALYRLYAAPGEVSDIALQPGETVTAISAGDTVRWTIGKTTSGSGRGRQVHILIKPFAAGLTTDLVILTSRHVYHLLLASTRQTAMLALSWRYPSQLVSARARAPASVGRLPYGHLSGLHFRYEIRGAHTSWRPQQVFDDGHKVYIAFSRRLGDSEAPPLFVLGRNKAPHLVNYRVQGRYYIVDHLFKAAELRFGNAPQKIVEILRQEPHAPQRKTHDSWF
jgi:type IV secretion system protein VirB9